MRYYYYLFVISLAMISCAKRGNPSGGPIDTLAPELLKATPSNFSTNFTGKEIRLNFNEYITLDNLDKQLVISPPMKIKPTIVPQSGASKYIKITINDTLQANTTYSFNFGNSIVDNNEKNPLEYFKYIFSTGSQIDSLTLKGSIKDALLSKNKAIASVLLYEVNASYSDSIAYKELPRYITNTLQETNTFEFENLKAGTYALVALEEESSNNKFNPQTDKIAFSSDHITLPKSDELDLTLFKEQTPYKALKPKHKSTNRLSVRYEGRYSEQITCKVLNKNLPEAFSSKLTKNIDNDTLNYWFTPSLKIDSLRVVLQNEKQIDSFTVRLRKKIKADSLTFKRSQKRLSFRNPFIIASSTPIVKIDTSKIHVMDKDSIPVAFTVNLDELTHAISLDFKREEAQRYTINAYPGAFVDFFNTKNDTLRYKASTKSYADVGNMRLTLENIPQHDIIVQLVNKKYEVVYEQKGKNKKVFDFNYIQPSTYFLRVIYDANSNGMYDTGDYLSKVQPERVSYYPEEIELRPNWDIEQKFILK